MEKNSHSTLPVWSIQQLLLHYANVMEPTEMSSMEQNPEINHQSKKTSSSSHHLETQLVEGKAKTGF